MNPRLLFLAPFLLACAHHSDDGLRVSATVHGKLPEGALAALENPESLELLSLDPGEPGGEAPPSAFHTYAVLGKTPLEGADRTRIVQALYDGITDSDGTVAACFEPRHGIRAKGAGHTVDVVICFKCLFARPFIDGKPIEGSPITEKARALYNQTLTAAGVPLPKR